MFNPFYSCGCFEPYRYNCNRYNEDDAKAARDAQEVINMFPLRMSARSFLHKAVWHT